MSDKRHDAKPHAEKRGRFYFFQRSGSPGHPPGVTVSKRDVLPSADFKITEYTWQEWGYVVLWFVDVDCFSANERQAAYRALIG